MDTNIPFPRALGAYLLAVSCAALVFFLGNVLISSRFSLAVLALDWIMAFVAALLPYAAGVAYAIYRGIRSSRYFLGGAVATALAFAPLLAVTLRFELFLKQLPVLAAAGLAGGAACWLCVQSKSTISV